MDVAGYRYVGKTENSYTSRWPGHLQKPVSYKVAAVWQLIPSAKSHPLTPVEEVFREKATDSTLMAVSEKFVLAIFDPTIAEVSRSTADHGIVHYTEAGVKP